MKNVDSCSCCFSAVWSADFSLVNNFPKSKLLYERTELVELKNISKSEIIVKYFKLKKCTVYQSKFLLICNLFVCWKLCWKWKGGKRCSSKQWESWCWRTVHHWSHTARSKTKESLKYYQIWFWAVKMLGWVLWISSSLHGSLTSI